MALIYDFEFKLLIVLVMLDLSWVQWS